MTIALERLSLTVLYVLLTEFCLPNLQFMLSFMSYRRLYISVCLTITRSCDFEL